MSKGEIDYSAWVDEALRGVLRRTLEVVIEKGLPGQHHLLISFRTDQDDVDIPAALRHSYPEEMTIVLQHQFWDLVVDDEAFEVSLRFGGQPARLRIPWQAIQSFVDPEAEFGLRFRDEVSPRLGDGIGAAEIDPEAPGTIVSLEDFRKKQE